MESEEAIGRRVMRRYLAGYALSMLGTGLWLPLNAIYLNEEMGLSVSTVGLYYLVGSAVSIGANLIAGPLADKTGPIKPFVVAGLLQAAGIGILAFAPSMTIVFVAAVVSGLGNGSFFAVQTSVLARIFGKDNLSTVFGKQYQMLNIAIGAGALTIGGLVHQLGHRGYVIGFSLNAISYAIHVLNVAGPVRNLAARASSAQRPSEPPPKRPLPFAPYADRTFLPIIALQLCLVMFGYAQLAAAMPIVFKQSAALPIWGITVFTAFNCIAVVLIQPWSTRYVNAKGHVSGLKLALLSWLFAILPALAAGFGDIWQLRLAAVCFFGMVFALGETLISPSMHPLAASRAPEGRLATYTAAVSLVYGLGNMAGPTALLPVFGQFGATAYWLVVACGTAAGLLALRAVRRSARQTPEQNAYAAATT